MPKKSFFPYTNKILELGTQDFLFSIPHKFHTGTGEWSEISHCLVEAVRNQALCDQNKGGLRNFTLPAEVVQNRAIVVKKCSRCVFKTSIFLHNHSFMVPTHMNCFQGFPILQKRSRDVLATRPHRSKSHKSV